MKELNNGNAESNRVVPMFNHPAWRSYDNYEEPADLFAGFILRCMAGFFVGVLGALIILSFLLVFYFGKEILSLVGLLFL